MPHVELVHAHIPPPVGWPASLPQIVPHFPQFVMSVFVSTHVAPHLVWPLGH
jgi:hypothetical protein